MEVNDKISSLLKKGYSRHEIAVILKRQQDTSIDVNLKILNLLKKGYAQSEIADILKKEGIVPNSLSSVEKKLNQLKKDYKAKTLFHLAVILMEDESFDFDDVHG